MKAETHDPPRLNVEPQKPAPIFRDMNADCQSIVVKAPATEVYRYCLQFKNLSQFISSITKIEKISDTCFACTSIANSAEVRSDVEIIMRVPDRRIAWRAVSDNFRVGVIFFDPLLGGATRMTVKVRSIAEPVLLAQALSDYLKKFKNCVERRAGTKRD